MAGEGLLPPLILELRAKAGEVHSELKKVGDEVDELDHKTEGGMSRSGKAFSGLASAGKAVAFGVAGAGAAIVGFGLEATQTAQVADAKLKVAIDNAGGSMEAFEPQIDKTDAGLRRLGFTNADTNTALAQLTTSLHDPKKAMEDMGLAADLARTKNIPLAQSALLVAKASEGQTRPLKALGIDLPVYAGGAQNVKLANMALAAAQQKVHDILAKTPDAMNPASKAHAAYQAALEKVQAAQTKLSAVQHSGDTIMAALQQRVHGAADAFGGTLQGQIAASKAQLDDVGEKVGGFVIPKLEDLIKIVSDVVNWFSKHTTVAKILAGIIGGVLAVSIAAYVAALIKAKVQAAAQFVQMVAGWMGLGPAAETAAAAVVAADEEMAEASEAAGAASDAAFGPVGLAVAALGIVITLLATHWQQVWAVITGAVKDAYDDVIKPVFGAVAAAWHATWSAVTTTLHALGVAWSAVWGAAKAVYDSVIKPVFGFVGSVFSAVGRGVTDDLHAIQAVWSAVWYAVRAVWTGVISPVFHFIGTAISGVETTISGVLHRISSAWGSVWRGMGAVVRDVVHGLGAVVSGIWTGVKDGIADAINGGITIINDAIGFINSKLIDTANDVPFVNIPHIPMIPLVHFAQGGNAGDGWGMAGENGPELFQKSGSSLHFFSTPQTASKLSGGGQLAAGGTSSGPSSNGGGGGQVVEVHSHLHLDGKEIYESVQTHQLRAGMRRGVSYQGYQR